MFKNSETFI